MDTCGVVYKIDCTSCLATYIAETKGALKTRINEHKKDLSKKSVVAIHAINNAHEINWKDVKILDKEPNYNKSIISEMIQIKIHNNTTNKIEDTQYLNHMYNKVFRKLR